MLQSLQIGLQLKKKKTKENLLRLLTSEFVACNSFQHTHTTDSIDCRNSEHFSVVLLLLEDTAKPISSFSNYTSISSLYCFAVRDLIDKIAQVLFYYGQLLYVHSGSSCLQRNHSAIVLLLPVLLPLLLERISKAVKDW